MKTNGQMGDGRNSQPRFASCSNVNANNSYFIKLHKCTWTKIQVLRSPQPPLILNLVARIFFNPRLNKKGGAGGGSPLDCRWCNIKYVFQHITI